jgi:hypothetical protein
MNAPNKPPSYAKPPPPSAALALAYIQKHPSRKLFPCRGKSGPCIKDNLAQASNDPAQIIKWAKEFAAPDLMWACSPKVSGIFCIDIDVGNGKIGEKSWGVLRDEVLLMDGVLIADTETGATPSGGRHFIFEGEHKFSQGRLGRTPDLPAAKSSNVDCPNYFMIPGQGGYKLINDVPAMQAPPSLQLRVKPPRPDKKREPSGEAIPLDVFKRMLAATTYTGGPAGLDDRHTYNGWLNFLFAAHDAAGGDEGDYLESVIEWSLADPNQDWDKPTSRELVEDKWRSITDGDAMSAAPITRGTWIEYLRQTGQGGLAAQAAATSGTTAAEDFAADSITDEEIEAYFVKPQEDIAPDVRGIGDNSGGLVVFGLDTVKSRNVDFIWPGRLARGKHTALAGIGGIGKSQITIDVAARVTTGSAWPDIKEIRAAGWSKNLERAPQGYVIIMSAEDAPDDTILPRLIAAGGDPKFVKFLSMVKDDKGNERKFNLQTDLAALRKYCLALGYVVLIVIDPASSYMGGDIDAGKNTKVRHVLDPITKLAEDLQCAIVSITHFRKGTSAKAVEKVMDSVAFVNAPRCALAVYEDPSDIGADFDSPGYVMLRLKSNLPGTPPVGLAYRIEGVEGGSPALTDYRDGTPIKTSKIVWQGKTDLTADQVAQMENDKGTPKLDEARKFLADALPEGILKPVAEVMAQAEAEGLAPDTVKRAKRALKVKAKKSGPEAGAPWVWYRGRDLDFDDADPTKDGE